MTVPNGVPVITGMQIVCRELAALAEQRSWHVVALVRGGGGCIGVAVDLGERVSVLWLLLLLFGS